MSLQFFAITVKNNWAFPIALPLLTLPTQTPSLFRAVLVWDAGLPLKQQEPSEKFRFVISLSQDSSPTAFWEWGGCSIHMGNFQGCPPIAKCLLSHNMAEKGKLCSHCLISWTLLFLFWYPHWKDYTKLLDCPKIVKCFTLLRRGITCILPNDTTDLMTPQTGWIFWDICTSELLPQAIPHYLLLTNEQSGGWFF